MPSESTSTRGVKKVNCAGGVELRRISKRDFNPSQESSGSGVVLQNCPTLTQQWGQIFIEQLLDAGLLKEGARL